MEKENSTEAMVELIMKKLTEQRYSKQTLEVMRYNFNAVNRFLIQNGSESFDVQLALKFIEKTRQQEADGCFSRNRSNTLCKCAERLIDFSITNEVSHTIKKRGTIYKLHDEYEKLLNDFMRSRNFHPNTYGDFEWAVRRYLHYFQSAGIFNISDITNQDIRNFILHSSATMKPNSLNNLLCYTRQFQKYLQTTNKEVTNGYMLLSQHTKQHIPIQNHIMQEELNILIDTIDTDTVQGKRDKAIILLATTSGMRAIDIARLKLTDINWCTGEINIYQNKTGKVIALPLLEIAGEAIKDYILNGRPKSNSSEIFLRSKAPFSCFKSGVAIECLFVKYLGEVGIERTAFDGRGFHSIRRLLAKQLLISGSTVTTVSQILGHSDLQTASRYLKMNSEMLKECSLPLSLIPFSGGAINE